MIHKLYDEINFNFGALPIQDYKKSKVVIFQFPYNSTTSLGSGTNGGPHAITRNSQALDEMTADGKGDLDGFASSDIYTLPEFVLSKNSAQEAVGGVKQAVTDYAVKPGKFPLVLGGEHSITSGVTRALKKQHGNFCVLQIDAHTDLINEFEGTKFSHACVMRRVLEQGHKLVQVGIRNINLEIAGFLKASKVKTFYGADVPIEKIVGALPKKVYLSVDLDGLDPSIMPAVGTPEPGGILWNDIVSLIRTVFKKREVVGADVVELAPIPGLTAPDFTAAKLVYEIIKAKLTK
jgi:agmatinase